LAARQEDDYSGEGLEATDIVFEDVLSNGQQTSLTGNMGPIRSVEVVESQESSTSMINMAP
jgi:hypothetical protein